jgi:uncharacterized membrane protein
MFLKIFAIAFPVFLLIDLIWIGVIAKNFYAKQIGALLKADVNWYAAILFYLIFITGLIIFVINPAIAKSSLMHALVYGAFFGLVCYATYDLTNLALTKDWPLLVTVVDLIWGAFIAASVSLITYIIATKILV